MYACVLVVVVVFCLVGWLVVVDVAVAAVVAFLNI